MMIQTFWAANLVETGFTCFIKPNLLVNTSEDKSV